MRSLHPVVSFVDHFLHAKSRFGVHSPFVYSLIKDVLRAKGGEREDIESLRMRLESDHTYIDVLDLGAGSRAGMGDQRRVSDIVRRSAHGIRDCALMYRLVEYFQPSTIVELGTSLGIGTSYLAMAAPDAVVATIEGCPATHRLAKSHFEELQLANVRAVEGSFNDSLGQVIDELGSIDFLYMDGDHRYEPTIAYFEQCLPALHSGSVVLMDDIHWSREMKQAWKTLCDHERVTVSIDLFRFGLLFFKNDQAVQNFKIHY